MTRPPRGTPSAGGDLLGDYADACREIARERGAEPVLGGVAAHLALTWPAQTTDLELPEAAPAKVPDIPPALARPELLGWLLEALLEPGRRRRSGSFYTAPDIASGVVALALETWPDIPATVCDPTVGGGAFLLAAARAFHAAGIPRERVVERHVWGADVDSLAARVTRDSLRLWVAEDAEAGALHALEPNVVVADTLLGGLASWPDPPVMGFDAIVGNPPFLGQLRRDTARSRDEAARLRAALPGLGAYTDTAAMFLLGAVRMVCREGVVALVVPESVLSARDAAGIRDELVAEAALRHLWLAREPVFSARVRVCVPVLQRRRERVRDGQDPHDGEVARSTGRRFSPTSPAPAPVTSRDGASWSGLVAGMLGVPAVVLDRRETLGSYAESTAGFRDQFYGLQPYVIDDPDGTRADRTYPRLVTSGSIDVATCSWGRRPTSFARRQWKAPRIDLEALRQNDPVLHAWALDRLRTKLVVAQQTRVIEAAVDEAGCWYPSTPTIAVTPAPEHLWLVAAVVLAPPVAAWMHGEMAGSGLAAGHLRLTASRMREVPMPPDRKALAEGAELVCAASRAATDELRREHLEEFAAVMTRAYGAALEVADWWLGCLAPRKRA